MFLIIFAIKCDRIIVFPIFARQLLKNAIAFMNEIFLPFRKTNSGCKLLAEECPKGT